MLVLSTQPVLVLFYLNLSASSHNCQRNNHLLAHSAHLPGISCIMPVKEQPIHPFPTAACHCTHSQLDLILGRNIQRKNTNILSNEGE